MRTAWTQQTFLRVIQGAKSPELVRIGKYALDIAGRCERPRCIEVTARPHRDHPVPREWPTAGFLDMEVACRRCPTCAAQRASLWRERASRELEWTRLSCRRSWFVTLTLRPSSHLQMRYRAIWNFNDRGRSAEASSFEALGDDDQRQSVERQSAFEVVKYLKRLRKAAGARFRYLVVTEAHRSGEVHYHVLVHEVQGELREKLLRQQWKLGFVRANLVRAGVVRLASYATKVARYISKAPTARVRCSLGYGCPGVGSTFQDIRRRDSPEERAAAQATTK